MLQVYSVFEVAADDEDNLLVMFGDCGCIGSASTCSAGSSKLRQS